ncbi:MAG: ABC transporter substrate-binding protein [Anaerolineae bacterium]
MSKRSYLLSFMLVVVFMTMVFAMSLTTSMAQDATATPPPTITPAVAEMGTGGTHISFWNGLTGSDGVTLNAMLAQFATEHPDFSVTTEIIPWATLYTKLQAAFVAGQAPDVFLIRVAQLPQFVSYGVVSDLSSWYTSGGGTLPDDDFAQPAFSRVFIDGAPYAVPLDNHGRGAWINKDLFTAAGLDPDHYPADYEELISIAQQLTLDANGNNAASPDFDPSNTVQWGLAFDWPYTDWISFLYGNGGTMVSEDGKTATVNSEASVKALQRMYDLIYVYHVAPPPFPVYDSWLGYPAGQLAIITTGSWFRNHAVNESPGINGEAWPALPIGDQRSAWIGSHVFVVPNSTTGAQLDAVKTMVTWVADHEVDWAASGQVPARISAQAALDPATYPSNILLGQTFQQYGHLEPQCISLLEFEDAMNPELSAALNDQKTPQQALDDANARIQEVLNRTPC